jgi:hypothetical protein
VKIDEPSPEEKPCGKRPGVADDCVDMPGTDAGTDADDVLTGRLGVGEAVQTGAVAAVEEDGVAMETGSAVDDDRRQPRRK